MLIKGNHCSEVILQGEDAAGARYTLLGFVQHMGTMRSGHYEACVQRGLSMAHSPAVLTLLRKHGIELPTEPGPASSNKPGKKASKATVKATAAEMHLQAKSKKAAEAAKAAAKANVASLQSSATAESEGGAGTSGSAAPVPEAWDVNDSSSADVAESSQSSSTAVAGQTDTQPESESSRGNSSDSAAAGKVTQPGQVDSCAEGEKPDADENVSDDMTSERGPSDSGQDPANVPRTWYRISDAHVRAISEADVLSREAYILLYMRVA